MNKQKTLMIAILSVWFGWFAGLSAHAMTFKDLPDEQSHWAYDTIMWAAERGIVGGDEEGKFRPNEPVTEAEFLTMLILALGVEEKEVEEKHHWSDGFYAAAEKYELPLTYEKDKPIRRGLVAKIIAHSQGYEVEEKQAVQWLYDQGLSNGKNGEKTYEGFAPDEYLTRAETVTFIRRLLEGDFFQLESDLGELHTDFIAQSEWEHEEIDQFHFYFTDSADDAEDKLDREIVDYISDELDDFFAFRLEKEELTIRVYGEEEYLSEIDEEDADKLRRAHYYPPQQAMFIYAETDEDVRSVFTHEIVHVYTEQKWNNSALKRNAGGVWLTEGLAEFLTYELSGVNPDYEEIFAVQTEKRDIDWSDLKTLADMEAYSETYSAGYVLFASFFEYIDEEYKKSDLLSFLDDLSAEKRLEEALQANFGKGETEMIADWKETFGIE